MREPTHWVLVPVTEEQRKFAVHPLVFASIAEEKFRALNEGEIIEGPWFHKWQDDDTVLDDGRILKGPAAIFYAVLEKSV